MKISKALSSLIADFKQSDSYWTEAAKLQFSVQLEKQRKAANLTYKAIADRIGASAAYVSKVFRGDSNLTIESMVKLARATGGHLDVRVSPESIEVSDWSRQWSGVTSTENHISSRATAVVIDFQQAAANRECFWKQAA